MPLLLQFSKDGDIIARGSWVAPVQLTHTFVHSLKRVLENILGEKSISACQFHKACVILQGEKPLTFSRFLISVLNWTRNCKIQIETSLLLNLESCPFCPVWYHIRSPVSFWEAGF